MSRIDEIRERWSKSQCANDVAVLLGEIDKLQKWLSMSCVTPVEHCTCTGCRYAAELEHGQEFEANNDD